MTEVSVVIPTYNRGDIINRAIDSALAQTLSDVEIIVVDDASTDETISKLESYGDQIRYYRHDENQGGSAARNTGIKAASGEYVAFLDSDDTWKPTKLEKQAQLLKQRDDSWVAVYCDFKQRRSSQLVEAVDHLFRRPTGFEGGKELIDRILLRRFAHGGASTLMVKREAIQQINGFNSSFRRHQDLEFLIRILQTGKLAYVDEKLVIKNDTGSPPGKVVTQAAAQFNEEFADLIAERGYTDRVKRIQRFMIAKHYLREGEILRGLQTLISSECPHYRDMLGAIFALQYGLQQKLAEMIEI